MGFFHKLIRWGWGWGKKEETPAQIARRRLFEVSSQRARNTEQEANKEHIFEHDLPELNVDFLSAVVSSTVTAIQKPKSSRKTVRPTAEEMKAKILQQLALHKPPQKSVIEANSSRSLDLQMAYSPTEQQEEGFKGTQKANKTSEQISVDAATSRADTSNVYPETQSFGELGSHNSNFEQLSFENVGQENQMSKLASNAKI
jgi:hypothetical protein